VLLLLYSGSSLAINTAFQFNRISTEQGLSQVTIHDALHDTDGYLWAATENGLNRYDGYQFSVFRHDPNNKSSISNNYVLSLFEDDEGVLWAGTNGGGLNRFNKKTESFTHFQLEQDNPRSLSSNVVKAIVQDTDGVLWLATNNGLNKLLIMRTNQTTKQFVFTHFYFNENNEDNRQGNDINVLTLDNQGRLWVASANGDLHYYDKNINQFIQIKLATINTPITTIRAGKNNTLWLGTEQGLFQYDTVSNTLIINNNEINTLNGQYLTALLLINDELWIGTKQGGYRYHTVNKELEHFQYHENQLTSLSHDQITTVTADGNGGIWLGTFVGGLNRFDTNKAQFNHTQSDQSSNSLSSNIVISFLEQEDNLFIGTYNYGLNIYNKLNDSYALFEHDVIDEKTISQGIVSAIIADENDDVWIGTVGGGLNLYDKNTGSFKHFQYDSKDKSSLSHNNILTMVNNEDDSLWLGTWGGGLNHFDKKTKLFSHFKQDKNNKNSLSGDIIWSLLKDNHGILWIGTETGGLNRFDPKSGQFTHYQNEAENKSSLSNNQVLSIYQDKQGILWLGTAGGLNRFEPKTKQFTRYYEKDGLANNTIYGILSDNQGYLWLSTVNGISKFDPNTEQFKNYDVNDGLQSNEFSALSYYKSQSGELYFGGTDGFNHFYPKNIKDDITLPHVILTDFLVHNEVVAIRTNQDIESRESFSIKSVINELDSLTLTYHEKLISFEFTALHFAEPMNNQYAYSLEGFDDDWIYTDAKNRRATYTNLPAGEYTLRVKASNGDGYWDERGKSLKIKILPPLWKTWWAYTFYFLTIILALGSFVYRQNYNRLKEHAINIRLTRVDRLKDEFLANTSHELRTPLNGIIGLAESLIDGVAGPLPKDANKNLAMVVASGKRLSNLVNDILDFSKLKSHNLRLNTQALDLYSMVDVVLSLSVNLVGDKNLKLINGITKGFVAVDADENRIQQILHNLVGNAIKFTEHGSVTITATEQNNWVKISITDTGIGISEGDFEHIFKSFEQLEGDENRHYGGTGLGLAVSKQLVELHGGIIKVESVVNEGSTFSITLPLSQKSTVVLVSKNKMTSRLEQENKSYLSQESADKNNIKETDTDSQTTCLNREKSRFRILIVDDDAINRQVLFNHLSVKNYQLEQASGGEEAITTIIENGPFDLVLLDVMMPKISGYEVCKRIRTLFSISELPIIFLTAKNQEADLVQSFLVGANDYLSKPVSKHELLSRVKTHLNLIDITRDLENKVIKRTAELKKATDKAEHATNAKSEFLAKMSHEIRTPMNAVIGLSRLSLKTHLNETQKDYAEKILDSGETLLSLINDILDFSKIEAGKVTIENVPFKLEKLLQRSINLSAINAHAKGLELVTDVENHLPQILMGDPLRLQQIIVNLVNNAVKFTEQGTVCIKVTLNEESENDVSIQFSVIDTGIGMSKEQQSKMFQSFSQADESVTRKYGGTGLGLSISKQLCELMDGEIWLESEVSVGSTFNFLVKLDKTQQDIETLPIDKARVAQLRVLVVDDISLARNVILSLLSEMGIEAEQIDNGVEAIVMVRQAIIDRRPYDIVLMDWRMPEMDGIEVSRLMYQEHHDNTPHILMVSAYDKDEAKSQLSGSMVQQFIEKPVNQSILIDVITNMMAKAGTYRVIPSIDDQTQNTTIPQLAKFKILLVEDNAINRQVAIGFLQDTQVKIDVAENGLIAIDKCKKIDYDLILMDIQMPEMDGLTATEVLRKDLGMTQLPIIAMTAHAMEADIERSRIAGMNAHITKPIDPDVLYDTISSHLLTDNNGTGNSDNSTGLQNDTEETTDDALDIFSQLQSLEAIDADKALKQMGGRRDLYLSLVKGFKREQQELTQKIQQLFSDHDWQTLYRLIHSLKSNAAYIGAYKLSAISATFEASLEEKEQNEKLLAEVVTDLSSLLSDLQYVELEPSILLKDDKFSMVRLKHGLVESLPLLKAYDFAVEEIILDLQNICSTSDFEGRINIIAAYINDVEYEQASTAVNKLLKELKGIMDALE